MDLRDCSIASSCVNITNAVLAVSKHGNCCVPRLASCQKISEKIKISTGISGGLELRIVSDGSRKRAFAVRAANSGSMDAPASTNKSRGPARVQSHLALLERMTENSTASRDNDAITIRDQLSSQIEPEAAEVVIPLVANPTKQLPTPVAELTISQKRNIRRQNYMNRVTERDDSPFFAAVAGVVLVPPILILGVAIATGYVEFFP